ncbi:metal ABC transporter permease [Gleimia sp. 6138-11-ORH1]|uniref:metal ABC transporter permease n=1 Tax=Gleimia sp. 6138-11-ORH1 TaxID=2973937 RepID=UPI00216941F6|nr:metal ABC transporter permease [Gleimia sp. 6138-11-ORH1]MCS4484200.1 metal ABC transporter permease [Gleimia sp. 6138-11-ORH1]
MIKDLFPSSPATLFDALTTMLSSPLMQRSLLVAALVGVCAPVIGTYLVQRKLAMLGDGIGHVALTGVALGWLTGTFLNLTTPETLAIPGALIVSLIGAVVLEIIRLSGKTESDVALAILFYGGIAGGVLLIGFAGGTSSQLNSYLFGSLASVSKFDVWTTVGLATIILTIGLGLSPALYAVCNDEEFAKASGLPVRSLNLLIAVLAAFTVAISMRVVGSLLISALMIVPVATAQVVTTSFKRTLSLAMFIGATVAVTGLVFTYFFDVSPGATIVVFTIFLYGGAHLLRTLFKRI